MVPVDEAIQVAIDCITSDSDPVHAYNMPPALWKRAFEFCTKLCNFQFQGKNYDQIEGLSMGNPLAPPLANLFMVEVERRALALGLFKPLFWCRYVDDIYCILTEVEFQGIDNILTTLNGVHPSINFTVETESEGCLSFLQVKCSNNKKGSFDTSVYRKPTHTNLYVKWDSAHPMAQKLGIFRTLLHQGREICSTHMAYQQEKNHLTDTFLELGYPNDLLQRAINKFETQRLAEKPPKELKPNYVVLSLPYVPNISEPIVKSWKRCAKNLNTDIPAVITFRPVKKLSNFLCKRYEKEPDGRGVYKATCGHCPSFYIGETSLFLTSRSKSHKYKGAPKEHAETTGHKFDSFNWEMLYNEPEKNKRVIAEGMFIRALNPDLNRKIENVNPYVFIDQTAL